MGTVWRTGCRREEPGGRTVRWPRWLSRREVWRAWMSQEGCKWSAVFDSESLLQPQIGNYEGMVKVKMHYMSSR